QILTIPYAITDAIPDILSFSTSSAGVNASDIENARAEIPVSLEVINRLPGTNLRFEQVLPDGRWLSVEKSRPHQWLPSIGQGTVIAASADDPRGVVLRLSIVNLLDSSVINSAEIIIPVNEIAAQPTPIPDQPQQEPASPPESGEAPRIPVLTVSQEDANYGDAVMISWEVENPASITLTAAPGDRTGINIGIALQNTGSMSYTLPDGDYYRVELLLTAENTAGREQRSAFVFMNCRIPYFFNWHHSALLCPEAPAAEIHAAYETFEGGNMIWRSDTDSIYVFYGNGQFAVFPDTFEEGESINITGTPPDGLLAPVRGFGKVWAENPLMQDALGWATQGELGYTMIVQREASGARVSRTYITLFDGRVIFQSTAGTGVTAGGTWGYVQN
ncbi:MAG TPA: hypothetical protein VJZ27_00630, partial [Aggregatilineales bacterium]|nr:hypothetical protein [Aggregatilineales bacterium]